MLYSDYYNCYLRDTIAATLFSYGFQLVSWPDDFRSYREGVFRFGKEPVWIALWVCPDIILGVEIEHPTEDRVLSLDTLLKKRGVGKRRLLGQRFIEAEMIAEAMIDYCQDILAGELPPELVRPKSEAYVARKRRLTYSDLYNGYLKDTVARLLLKHGFELASRPSTADKGNKLFTFRRNFVDVQLSVSSDFIHLARISGPNDDELPISYLLQWLVRRRGCDSGPIDRASTRTAMARAITDALQDYCPDVLAGDVPAELLEKRAEYRTIEALRKGGGRSSWVPDTTPTPKPRRQGISLTMVSRMNKGSTTPQKDEAFGKRGPSE